VGAPARNVAGFRVALAVEDSTAAGFDHRDGVGDELREWPGDVGVGLDDGGLPFRDFLLQRRQRRRVNLGHQVVEFRQRLDVRGVFQREVSLRRRRYLDCAVDDVAVPVLGRDAVDDERPSLPSEQSLSAARSRNPQAVDGVD
jgi:hypothetical protein